MQEEMKVWAFFSMARATSAWKQGGEVWEAVSSRVIMVRLKLLSKGMLSMEQTSSTFLHESMCLTITYLRSFHRRGPSMAACESSN